MATGFMAAFGRAWTGGHFTCGLVLCLCCATLQAADVSLAGVLGSKAILVINGAAPRSLAPGQSVDGVRLLALQGDQAVVEIDGKRRSLRLGQLVSGEASAGGERVVLTADANGHYLTQGTINGRAVRFLVDTGATYVSLGNAEARRIGLASAGGQSVRTMTANGQGSATRIKLDKVQIGDIALYGVDAVVQETDMPFVLLGMSYLSRTDMQRDGNAMTLKKRF